jgi:predicted PurR-regulated permease PerM
VYLFLSVPGSFDASLGNLSEHPVGSILIAALPVRILSGGERVASPKIQGRAVNLTSFFIMVAVPRPGSLLGVRGALTAMIQLP